MVFSSAVFLCFFLPVFFLLYYIIAPAYRNNLIVAASIFFYWWGAPLFIFVILGTTITDFFLVRAMWQTESPSRRKLFLIISVTLNIGLLFYFKYSGFFLDNINAGLKAFGIKEIFFLRLVLPIGISFYTFETLTYVVDVYRKIHKPLDRFRDYLLYIILFPKLIAGPIIRYHEIADQLTDRSARDTPDERLTGFYRFCIGLSKKVLIANTLGSFVDPVYGTHEMAGISADQIGALSAWLVAICYTFQLYFDFSGYSDMAIGLGKMMGFRFPENFNNPYISQSITEFWRRWHITLGNWMRNYLYIPLGGNRVDSTKRLYFNLWLVFLLSGLWHGASWSFVIWGAWHGLFLVLERSFLLKATKRVGKLIRVAFTFLVVVCGWVVFRVEDIGTALKYLKTMFTGSTGTDLVFLETEQKVVMIMAVFFSFFCLIPGAAKIQERIYGHFHLPLKHVFYSIASICLFYISLSYITSGNFNPFIYFRF